MDFGENTVVLQSPAVTRLLTVIRDRETHASQFIQYSNRLFRILVEEGISALPAKEKVVETPVPGATFAGFEVDERNLCAVSIIRAGDSLLGAVREVLGHVPVGKILIQRDETTPEKLPKLFYSKLPSCITETHVMLVDPMLATGGSAICAINVLKEAGVKEENILFLNLVSCPEGIRALHAAAPAVKIVTAAVDPTLNEHKYIVPGLGDFGDRYFGTD